MAERHTAIEFEKFSPDEFVTYVKSITNDVTVMGGLYDAYLNNRQLDISTAPAIFQEIRQILPYILLALIGEKMASEINRRVLNELCDYLEE